MHRLRYIPNPKLPLETQQAIREDYMLDKDETLLTRCRKAVALLY